MDWFINCSVVYDIICLETYILDQNWAGLAVAEMQGHDYEPVVAIVLFKFVFEMSHFNKITGHQLSGLMTDWDLNCLYIKVLWKKVFWEIICLSKKLFSKIVY